MQPGKGNDTIVVSALDVRTGFGKLLRRVEDEQVLRLIGEESKRKGAHKLTSRDIDREIKAARAARRKRG